MAPKAKYRPGFRAVRPDDLLSIPERRARIAARRAALLEAPVETAPSADSARASSSTGEVLVPDAIVPVRSDFAAVRNTRRGDRTAVAGTDAEHHLDALSALRRDRVAASGRGTADSLLKTWEKFDGHARTCTGNLLPPELFPLSPMGVEHVAACFKQGGYRSFANYLSAVRAVHIEMGFDWTLQLDAVGKWCTRSVLRGIGPARQSCPFRMDLLFRWHARVTRWCPVAPAGLCSQSSWGACSCCVRWNWLLL